MNSIKINDLTDQEKSVMLAKARGWYQVDEEPIMGARWQEPGKPNNYWLAPPDLYPSKSMALAKKTIAWGWLNVPSYREWLDTPGVAVWILVNGNGVAFGLDKLVIEAGLVALEEEKER